DPESRGFALDERRIRLGRLRDGERIAGLWHGEAIEHGGGVANRFDLDEVLREAVAELVELRPVRDASARGLEPHAAAVARGNADRATDVGAVRDRHDAGHHRGHAATGRSSCRMACAPRRAGVAVERTFGRAGHRVFWRRRAAQDVETGRANELAVVRVLLNDQAATQPAAELDL